LRNIIIILLIFVSLFIAGCQQSQKACTQEAKICADGSAVGRTWPNCEFAPCPNEVVDSNPIVCGPCPMFAPPAPGWCSNGTIVPGKKDECNCTSPPRCLKEEDKHYCSIESRKAEVCPTLYQPVCGWFNKNVQCVKYPCAIRESNACIVCLNNNVEYYTEGECPK
jgi:hypothetical protein